MPAVNGIDRNGKWVALLLKGYQAVLLELLNNVCAIYFQYMFHSYSKKDYVCIWVGVFFSRADW